jgi:hypothetical protein
MTGIVSSNRTAPLRFIDWAEGNFTQYPFPFSINPFDWYPAPSYKYAGVEADGNRNETAESGTRQGFETIFHLSLTDNMNDPNVVVNSHSGEDHVLVPNEFFAFTRQ